MRTMMKLIGGAAVALLMGAGAASAQLSVQAGVQGGGSIVSTELSSGPFAIDGIGARSSRPDIGARVGADWHVPNSPFVIGAFGEWNNQDVAFSVSPGIFSASLGNSYSVGSRVGMMVGTAMPYLGAAYTHTSVGWSTSSPLLPDSFSGVTYLGGIEIPVRDSHFSLALETRWTRYSPENIGGVGGIDLRPDQLQGMLRVNYNFGEPAKAASLK